MLGSYHGESGTGGGILGSYQGKSGTGEGR